MSKRVKKPRPPASISPHECVVLAVDTAAVSGWAVYVNGELWSIGEVDMLKPERSNGPSGFSGWNADRVCLHALWECAKYRGLPAVMVFERPFRGTTQGQWIGAWKQSWALNQGRTAAVVGVYPASWRARVLGGGRLARDNARKAELRLAKAVAGRDGVDDLYPETHPDACAAIGIGCWGVRAGEVGAVLPKRRARKAG